MDYTRPQREANEISYLVHAAWLGGMIDTILNSVDDGSMAKEEIRAELRRTLDGEVILDGYTDIPIVADLKSRLNSYLGKLKDHDDNDIDEEEWEISRKIDLQDDPEYLAEKNIGASDVR